MMLGPRDRGVASTTPMERLHTISVDETIQLDGMSVTGIRANWVPTFLGEHQSFLSCMGILCSILALFRFQCLNLSVC